MRSLLRSVVRTALLADLVALLAPAAHAQTATQITSIGAAFLRSVAWATVQDYYSGAVTN